VIQTYLHRNVAQPELGKQCFLWVGEALNKLGVLYCRGFSSMRKHTNPGGKPVLLRLWCSRPKRVLWRMALAVMLGDKRLWRRLGSVLMTLVVLAVADFAS
jgi:hypothetical protein